MELKIANPFFQFSLLCAVMQYSFFKSSIKEFLVSLFLMEFELE